MTILVGLIENGVNPEALAAVVKELKRETAALRVFSIHLKQIIVRGRNSGQKTNEMRLCIIDYFILKFKFECFVYNFLNWGFGVLGFCGHVVLNAFRS